LKELSDSFGVEGFLVLATQDHRKPLFFQGGSLLGDDYLRGLLDEGNPMRKFAIWTAGSKKVTSKKRMRSDLELQGSDEAPSKGTGQPPKKKTKYAVAAFENRDVCKGMCLNSTFFFFLTGLFFPCTDLSDLVTNIQGPLLSTTSTLQRSSEPCSVSENDFSV
jgi:hypothetical protein